MSKNILITGLPGTGKTTLITRLVDALRSYHPAGFYTREMREGGTRKGFQLVSLTGQKQLLSHCDIDSRHRVGKYGVDIDGFDRFLADVGDSFETAGIVVIDEIGKMECLSPRFCRLVDDVLSSKTHVLATIGLKGGGFMTQVRQRTDVELHELTLANRDRLPERIIETLTD